MDYVKLLPLINNVSVLEAIKLILLRLCLGELGHSNFDARWLDGASSIGKTQNHLNNMRGAEINILKPLTSPYMKQPKVSSIETSSNIACRSTPPRSELISTTSVGSLKYASLIAAAEGVESVVEKPRALVHAETQREVALVAEETGLLEEPPFECLSPSFHKCDDQFATCSIPVTYSYEIANAIDL